MAGEWREVALGEVIELKRGYDLPQKDRIPGKVPLVSSSGVTDHHAVAMAKGPGVVTGRYGTLGQVFYICEDFWPLNTALYVRDFKGNDPRFISYFLRSLDFLAYSDKAAVPGLNRNHLHQARVRLPADVREQRAIAHILSTLDDKIELNRRMNETLEAMARALFKSWFVDFDPVRAKAERRDPGLPKPLADLFPDSFEDSELGEIPKGWQVHDVYNLADVIYGAPLKSVLFNEDGVGKPLIRIRDLATHDPQIFTSEEHSRGYLVQPGDLIVGMDGEFRAHMWRGPEAWLNQRLCCFKPKAGVPRAVVHYSIESLLDFFERSKTGTTVIHLGKSDIGTFRVLVPPVAVLKTFGAIVDSMDARILTTAQQSRTLAALRDTLLPKLISGELRVTHGVQHVAEPTP